MTINGLLALIVIVSLCFVGCSLGLETEPSTAEAIVIPTRSPSPLPTDSPLPPQPTTTLIQAVTETPEGQTDISPEPGRPCSYEYFFEPPPPTCPLSPAKISFAAEQQFEHGVMIWLETTDSIYVFYPEDQSWQRFDDQFEEGQPESDPALTPPEGHFQPIRGFGKVWRENPEVRQRLGWALGVELAFESAIQTQAVDEGDDEVFFLRTFNGQIYALIHRGFDKGEWAIAAS